MEVNKRVRVVVFLKPGVLDAQGQAVQTGLRALGFEAEEVRVGKAFELSVPADGWRQRVRELCERFLTNPLIEQYEVHEREEVPGR
ncbi:MAG: phosphoribosylformylglycinamidine synthase subunit PurS [candidate division GAL15 bacterium]